MRSTLISGYNRGIGLEWVRQLAAAGWRYTTCQHPAEAHELFELSDKYEHVSIHRLDVASVEDARANIWPRKAEPSTSS